jgi:hypothetical protein
VRQLVITDSLIHGFSTSQLIKVKIFMAQKLWLPKTVRDAFNNEPVVKEQCQPCPKCGKTDNVHFNGYHRGKRQFKCIACKRSFVFPYADPSNIRRKNIIGKEENHNIELPFLDASNLLNQFNKPKITVDSVFDIPCFCCLEASRGCNPNSCQKMEIYLLKEVENHDEN